MKKTIGKAELVLYACCTAVFTALALFLNAEGLELTNWIAQPFISIGNLIRKADAASRVLSYFIYIAIGAVPLIFPTVRIIKTKRFHKSNLLWAALSGLLFVTLYFCVNPHVIQLPLLQDQPKYMKAVSQTSVLWGFSSGFVSLLILCLITELYLGMKHSDAKTTLYAQILFVILTVAALFEVFFIALLEARLSIAELPQTAPFELPAAGRGVNVFAITAVAVIKAAPSFFVIALYLKAKVFVKLLQKDMFGAQNLTALREIEKTSVFAVFSLVISAVLQNLIYMCLSPQLYNVSYKSSIPIGMILITCLIMIFSKLMIKAIELSEENKLVI